MLAAIFLIFFLTDLKCIVSTDTLLTSYCPMDKIDSEPRLIASNHSDSVHLWIMKNSRNIRIFAVEKESQVRRSPIISVTNPMVTLKSNLDSKFLRLFSIPPFQPASSSWYIICADYVYVTMSAKHNCPKCHIVKMCEALEPELCESENSVITYSNSIWLDDKLEWFAISIVIEKLPLVCNASLTTAVYGIDDKNKKTLIQTSIDPLESHSVVIVNVTAKEGFSRYHALSRAEAKLFEMGTVRYPEFQGIFLNISVSGQEQNPTAEISHYESEETKRTHKAKIAKLPDIYY